MPIPLALPQKATHHFPMRHRSRPSIYLRIRRGVDHDLSTRTKPGSPVLIAIPIIAAMLVERAGSAHLTTVAWILALALSTAWLLFIGWRTSRMFRASGIKGDRDYDRQGRFALPTNYANSESATRARRRRRTDRK
jgi:hypothetical protein